MATIAESLYDWIRIANEARERIDLPVGTIEEAIRDTSERFRRHVSGQPDSRRPGSQQTNCDGEG